MLIFYNCLLIESDVLRKTEGLINPDFFLFILIVFEDLKEELQSLCRPNVLMFNDYYWIPDRTEAQEKRFNRWEHSLGSATSLVVVEIGAGLAESSHLNENCALVRINPRDTAVPRSKDVSIALGGLEALQLIDEALQSM